MAVFKSKGVGSVARCAPFDPFERCQLSGSDQLNAVHSREQGIYLTQSAFEDVLHTFTPPQIRQLILHYYRYDDQVDRFMWELTLPKRL